jgi:hypothetical protein
MNIDINKQYKTRDGRKVEIIAIKPNLHLPVVGIVEGQRVIKSWDKFGCIYSEREESVYDLIEDNPYFQSFCIDDKVLVKQERHVVWKKRYFAGVNEDGNALVFTYGATSWNETETIEYEQCIKWEDRTEEMVISTN